VIVKIEASAGGLGAFPGESFAPNEFECGAVREGSQFDCAVSLCENMEVMENIFT